MKMVELEMGSSRKLMFGGLAALALAAGLMIWNGVSKEDPVKVVSAPDAAPAKLSPKPTPSTGNHDLATALKGEGKAQPPRDLPPIEELISKMPDGSPVKPIEIPDMTPVIRTEADRVLADVESRAEADPEAAAKWVESMPHGDLREESVAFVVEQWSKKDPAKASAWQQRMEVEAREN